MRRELPEINAGSMGDLQFEPNCKINARLVVADLQFGPIVKSKQNRWWAIYNWAQL